jgi:hypothetical protein
MKIAILFYFILISVLFLNGSSFNKNDLCYSKEIKCKTNYNYFDYTYCEYVCNPRLSKKDFCLIGKDCNRYDLSWISKFLIKSEKILRCLCKGKHNRQCDKNFCTTNNRVCKAIRKAEQKNIRNHALEIGVKKCQN